MIGSWIDYLLKRKSEYKIHSPFVYDFMRKVLNDHGTNRDYDTIYRIARLLDKRKHISYNQRKQSRLLYRLVRYFEPESVVSFGKLSALNTSALALGHLQTKVYLEESDDFLETLNSMGVVNVSLIQPAEFDSEHFKRLNTGFVFFSRDSFEEDTWDYLADCLRPLNRYLSLKEFTTIVTCRMLGKKSKRMKMFRSHSTSIVLVWSFLGKESKNRILC